MQAAGRSTIRVCRLAAAHADCRDRRLRPRRRTSARGAIRAFEAPRIPRKTRQEKNRPCYTYWGDYAVIYQQGQYIRVARIDRSGLKPAITKGSCELMSERIVSGEEEPASSTLPHHRQPSRMCERVGVEGVMARNWRASLVGDAGCSGPAQDHYAIALVGNIHSRERGRGRGHVDERIDVLLVKPFRGNSGSDVSLVLVIGYEHLDRAVQDFATEILDGHARRGHAGRTRRYPNRSPTYRE